MFITPIMHHFIQIAFVLFREVKAGFYITLVDSYWIQNRGLNSDGQKSFKHKGKDIHMCPGSTGPTVYDGGLPCALKRATLFFPSSASFPIINPSSLDYHAIWKTRICYLMSASNRFQVNCITTQLFKSLIKYHLQKAARSRSAFAFFFLSLLILILNGGRWKKREKRKDSIKKKKERSWVMDALCLSVVPNYWTLPFKASLRFSFLPFWLMKSRLWLGGGGGGSVF